MVNPTFWLSTCVGGLVILGLYTHTRKATARVSVLYGYPAGSRTWLTIYHYRHKDQWLFEWDDLFADSRPKHISIRECLMRKDNTSGATTEEHAKAWELLNKRYQRAGLK